jgi:hypothetical protein
LARTQATRPPGTPNIRPPPQGEAEQQDDRATGRRVVAALDRDAVVAGGPDLGDLGADRLEQCLQPVALRDQLAAGDVDRDVRRRDRAAVAIVWRRVDELGDAVTAVAGVEAVRAQPDDGVADAGIEVGDLGGRHGVEGDARG